MNHVSIVLTVLGKDRPGLVESIAEVVADRGANWIESRMAHLGGQFAGILHVEVAEDQASGLTDALRSLDEYGLDLVIHSEDPASQRLDTPLIQLDLVGQDRPGIVREITHVLASEGVNVEEFTTECFSAPTTGQILFQATAQLRLPSDTSETKVRQALERIATDLMIDITLQPVADS